MIEKLMAAHAAGQLTFYGTHAAQQRQGVCPYLAAAQEDAPVRLSQAPVRRTEDSARLSVALHPSRGDLDGLGTRG